MKEAVTKVIDKLTQEDSHRGFQYGTSALQPKEITSKGTKVSVKVAIRKNVWKLI